MTRRGWDSPGSGRFQLSRAQPGLALSPWDRSSSGCSCPALPAARAMVTALCQPQENGTLESQPSQTLVIWAWILNTARPPGPIQDNSLQGWPIALSFQILLQELMCHPGASPYCQCCRLTINSLRMSWCLEQPQTHQTTASCRFMNCTKYRTLQNKLTVTLAVHV